MLFNNTQEIADLFDTGVFLVLPCGTPEKELALSPSHVTDLLTLDGIHSAGVDLYTCTTHNGTKLQIVIEHGTCTSYVSIQRQ